MLRPLRILLLLCGFIALATIFSFHAKVGRHEVIASARDVQSVSFSGNTMGGTWSVKVVRPQRDVSTDRIQSSLDDLLACLDREMSLWKEDSALSKFNRYRGEDRFSVSRAMAEVASVAQQVSAQSQGAFDVTVAPLVMLWGFGPHVGRAQLQEIPSDDQIAAARACVGYHQLEVRLSPPALRKLKPELQIDLGGVAKGFAADEVGAMLRSLKIENYLIAIGGELRASGCGVDGKPWRVGIETPTPDIRRVFSTLELKDASLSTSGDYRNFFEMHGRRYCHEIDPRTGRPIAHNLASVSVIHSSGAQADAWATALMVLGPQRGPELARERKMAAMFIVRHRDRFEVITTLGFDEAAGGASHDTTARAK